MLVLLALARRVREQQRRQRGPKFIPCMRPKSNASAKAKPIGLTSSASRSALPSPSSTAGAASSSPTQRRYPGNPYDGHTLVVPDMVALAGSTIARILADKGYRGHNTPPAGYY